MTEQPKSPSLRDRAIDAVGQALNAARYWLPVEGRPVAVDAVLDLTAAELDTARRRAIRIQTLLDEQRDRTRKACEAMNLKADSLAREAATTNSEALLHLATGYGEAARYIAAAAFRSQPKEAPDA